MTRADRRGGPGPSGGPRTVRSLVAGAAVVALVLLGWVAPAGAHTGFESSEPADGSTAAAPVEQVTIRFTGEAEPTGEGFRALDASGALREPTEASSPDGRTWVLRFDPALAGGQTGVRWMVKAPDAHPIEGSFSFVAGGAAVEGAGRDGDLAEFLETPGPPTSARLVAGAGRMLSIVGVVLGVGAVAFAATVLRGRDRDVRQVMFWVRRAGVLVVGGALLELAGQVGLDGGGLAALASPAELGATVASTAGIAIGLRVVGGVALVVGAHPDTSPASTRADPLPFSGARAERPSGHEPVGGVEGRGAGSGVALADAEDRAWAPRWTSAGAFGGSLLLVLSFAFDGHTASKGPWVVHALVDAVHVAAVSVWVGGVAMLAAVTWHRHRVGLPVRATQLAVRFSVVATLALVAVGLTGVAMAVIILDGPGELVSTPWGRLLLVKVLVVAAAAGAGAHNHMVLVPAMADRSHDEVLMAHFRKVITAEALVLVGVALLTAWLVGAAS